MANLLSKLKTSVKNTVKKVSNANPGYQVGKKVVAKTIKAPTVGPGNWKVPVIQKRVPEKGITEKVGQKLGLAKKVSTQSISDASRRKIEQEKGKDWLRESLPKQTASPVEFKTPSGDRSRTISVTKSKDTSTPDAPGDVKGAYTTGGGGAGGGLSSASAYGATDEIGQPIDPNGIYDNLYDLTTDEGKGMLAGIDSEYDMQEEMLGNQLKSADADFALGNQKLSDLKGSYSRDIESSKQEQRNNALFQEQDALASAKEVERANRNMLRGLGILGSSAAGELLTKPYQNYDKVRGQIYNNLQTSSAKLDNYLAEKNGELTTKATELLNNWNTLKANIASDMRFTARDRAAALSQARALIGQKLEQVKLAKANYAEQVDQQKRAFAQQLALLNAQGYNIGDTGGSTLSQLGGNTTSNSGGYIDDKRNLFR